MSSRATVASSSGRAPGLEGELPLHRPRHAGREQRPLLRLRQVPQGGEGLAVVVLLHPVEGEAGAVGQHGLAGARVGEPVVVGAQRRPVRGLADRDVERLAAIAAGECRAAHLEQREIERGLEVAGQMRLDQRGADRAQVVREPDADARLLARLGLGVGARGRRGHRGRVEPRGPAVLAAVADAGGTGRPGPVRLAGAPRGHVLGPDQPLDDLERAVVADGDDAAGDAQVLAPERGAGLHGPVDLVEPRLEALRFRDQLFGPVLVVEVGQLVVAGAQPLGLGLLLVRGLGGLRVDAPEAGGRVPLQVELRLGPLPAGAQLLGGGLEPVHGEPVQEAGIAEPDAVLVLVGEQVAVDDAARGLVGVHADEARDGGGRRDPVLGQQAPDLPGARPVALLPDLRPHRDLARPVGGRGEGLEGIEVDPAGAVGVQQLGRGVAEAQPLLDRALGDAEAGGDGGDRDTRLGELREGAHLVGGVHGDADDVLRERQFAGLAAGGDQARHRMVRVENAVRGERLERGQAAPAGDDGEAVDAVGAGAFGADDQVLQQAVGGDGGLELGEGGRIGRGLAHVLGREREPAQRHRPDIRLGRGERCGSCVSP